MRTWNETHYLTVIIKKRKKKSQGGIHSAEERF